jgi:heptosyltransferase-2
VNGERETPAGHPDVVVRAPNHLGDLVMALPALQLAGAGAIVIRRPLVPLLEMARLPGRLIPLDRGAGPLLQTAGAVRQGKFRRGVLLTPSLSSALLLRLAGVPERRGTASDGRSLLLTDAMNTGSLGAVHRAAVYIALVSGEIPPLPPVPRLPVGPAALARWQSLITGLDRPIGIFPGSNASSRRWAPEQFRELVRRLAAQGSKVVIFGGPAERELTALVAGGQGLDLGGKTDLPTLGAGLAACRLLVTNDSGPMHLAAAVGTRTVSLWGAGDPVETGPLGPGQILLRHAELPCVPCRANSCPRRGAGTMLPRAERECLALISVEEVMEAVLRF